jgi:RNA recognition motif-containing protein
MGTVYVANLPFSATVDDLRSVFIEFGEIADARIAFQGDFGQGYGFVEFQDEAAFSACMSHSGPLILGDRPLKVEPARTKIPVEDNIFVHNIGQTVTLDQLKEHFRDFNVVDAKIVARYEDEDRRGYAFVKVASKSDRDRAIAQLCHSELGGRKIFVDAAKTRYEGPNPRKFRNTRVRGSKFS